MQTLTSEIYLSRKLIDKIKKKADKEKITFPQMIKNLYQVEPNNCLFFYLENGQYFKKGKHKRIKVESMEVELYKFINPESKVIVVKYASLGPINKRI